MTLTGLLFLTAALVGCSVNGDNVQQSSPASHPQSVPLDQTDPLRTTYFLKMQWPYDGNSSCRARVYRSRECRSSSVSIVDA